MKTYVKPDVFYEPCEMSVGVAACSGIVLNKDGSLKSCTDSGYLSVIEDGQFFGDACVNSYTMIQDIGYFGGTGAIWGSN